MPWQCIRQLRGQVERAEQLAVRDPPWALPMRHTDEKPAMDLHRLDIPEPEEDDAEAPGADDSSNSSSDSYSDQEAAASGSEDLDLDDDDEAPLPFRARESDKLHLQHFVGASGVVPYCRDAPFANMLQEGAQLLQTRGQWLEICQKCKRQATRCHREEASKEL